MPIMVLVHFRGIKYGGEIFWNKILCTSKFLYLGYFIFELIHDNQNINIYIIKY